MTDLFYLQDSRNYVGNDVLWWAKDNKGYTTDVSKAAMFSKEQAQAKHNCRETDIPWPKEYIDKKIRPAVDMQYIKRKEALTGTGIKIMKPIKQKTSVVNCCECGRFLSERQIYQDCPNCGSSANRP